MGPLRAGTRSTSGRPRPAWPAPPVSGCSTRSTNVASPPGSTGPPSATGSHRRTTSPAGRSDFSARLDRRPGRAPFSRQGGQASLAAQHAFLGRQFRRQPPVGIQPTAKFRVKKYFSGPRTGRADGRGHTPRSPPIASAGGKANRSPISARRKDRIPPAHVGGSSLSAKRRGSGPAPRTDGRCPRVPNHHRPGIRHRHRRPADRAATTAVVTAPRPCRRRPAAAGSRRL